MPPRRFPDCRSRIQHGNSPDRCANGADTQRHGDGDARGTNLDPPGAAAAEEDTPAKNGSWHWSVSEVKESLEGWIKEHFVDDDVDPKKGWIAVARAVLKHGAMREQDLRSVYEEATGHTMGNASRFHERLLAKLPVECFTTGARGQGWIAIAKGAPKEVIVYLLFQELKTDAKMADDFDQDAVDKLEKIATPKQKLILRYALISVYGPAEAKRRFGIYNADTVIDKVDKAKEVYTDKLITYSPQTATKYGQLELDNEQNGGKVPWYKEQPAMRAALIKNVTDVRSEA